jgi:hypothetical protein
MTKDDIIRMADLADYHADSLEFVGKLNGKTWKEVRDNYLAVLVAKAEREACVELIPPQYFELRDRIRARGQS